MAKPDIDGWCVSLVVGIVLRIGKAAESRSSIELEEEEGSS
jgi:hypothetical protein